MYKVYHYKNQNEFSKTLIKDLETLHYHFRGLMSMAPKGTVIDTDDLIIDYPDGSFHMAVRA